MSTCSFTDLIKLFVIPMLFSEWLSKLIATAQRKGDELQEEHQT